MLLSCLGDNSYLRYQRPFDSGIEIIQKRVKINVVFSLWNWLFIWLENWLLNWFFICFENLVKC